MIANESADWFGIVLGVVKGKSPIGLGPLLKKGIKQKVK